MKYYISTGYLDTREIVDIAKAADDLGYDGLGIPEHVVNLETLKTPYPYTRDGTRRWEPFTDWPDPWVLIGALAECTQRLRFVTTVYVAALRDPYVAAKSIGTAALLSNGRVELGLGVGWCAEEFELLNAQFPQRGKRTEEMIELIRALWSPGWTEFSGEFYQDTAVGDVADAAADPDLGGRLIRHRSAPRGTLRRLGRRPDHHRRRDRGGSATAPLSV